MPEPTTRCPMCHQPADAAPMQDARPASLTDLFHDPTLTKDTGYEPSWWLAAAPWVVVAAGVIVACVQGIPR